MLPLDSFAKYKYTVQFKYITTFFVNDTSIKLEKKKTETHFNT